MEERTERSRINAAEAKELRRLFGVRGWLAVFAAFAVLLLVYDALRTAAALRAGSTVLTLLMEAAPAVLLAATLVLLLLRNRWFRATFLAYVLLGLLSFFSSFFFNTGVFDYSPFLGLPWAVYLFNSKRVQVTCGERLALSLPAELPGEADADDRAEEIRPAAAEVSEGAPEMAEANPDAEIS